MLRLSPHCKDVQTCLKLAILLAYRDGGVTVRTWTACLLLLLLIVWRGPDAHCCFSWAAWQVNLGWYYGRPLCEQGVLCEERDAEGYTFFGNINIAPGFIKNIEKWVQTLQHQQDLGAKQDRTEPDEEPAVYDQNFSGDHVAMGMPRRKRRRGIALLLSSQQ